MTSENVFDLSGVKSIMPHILRYIPLNERPKLEIVSKKFQEYYHDSMKYTKHIDFQKIIPTKWFSTRKCRKVHNQILKSISSDVIKVRNIGYKTPKESGGDFDYSNVFPVETSNLSDLSFRHESLPKKFTQIFASLKNLKILEFNDVHFEKAYLNKSLLKCDNLQSLTLRECHFVDKARLFIPQNILQLYILNVSIEMGGNGFSPVKSLNNKPVKVEQLVIDCYKILNNEGLIDLLKDMKELRKFYYSGTIFTPFMSGQCRFFTIAPFESTQKLEELHLFNFHGHFEFTTDSLIEICPHLKKLSVSDESYVCYDKPLNILKYSPKLTEIYVDMQNLNGLNPKSAPVSIEALAKNVPNLEKLTLRNLPKEIMDKFSLSAIAILLPNLQYLDVSFSEIRDSHLQAMFKVLGENRPNKSLILYTPEINHQNGASNLEKLEKYVTENIPGLEWQKNNEKPKFMMKRVFNKLEHCNYSDFDSDVDFCTSEEEIDVDSDESSD